VKRESGAHARGRNDAHSSGPPSRGREGAGAWVQGAGPSGPTSREREVWAALAFPFSFKFSIRFLFIFSFKFKSNQTTNSNLNISNMCINQKQSLSSA
jgi:hypothetical protein